MDANGRNAKQIVPDGGTNSRHSFDAEGSIMVFNSNRGGSMEIWAANPDGSRMRQLTTGGNNSQPHISPDGASIVFRSVLGGIGSLYKVSSSGGEPTRLTENLSSWPRFAPDGKFIACVYRSESKTKIAVLNAVDGQPVKTFDYPVSANFNNGLRWTPDGKGITYRDWNNGIWKQSLDGGPPSRIEELPEEKLYAYGWSRDGKQFAFTRGTEIRDVVLISGIEQ
jgi:Tol biopolymer transport system component